MAYNHQDISKPDGASQNGSAVCQSVRDNVLETTVSMLSQDVLLPGWTMATSGGTAAQPGQRIYSSGVFRVKCVLTWVSHGISTNSVSWSDDSGSNYDSVGTLTITYDGSGNITAKQFTAS